MSSDVRVEVGESATSATHYEAAPGHAAPGLLVLAHGAGAGHRHPFMTAIAQRLAAAGVDVVTFNFLYMEQRKKAPDRPPALEACFRAVVAVARERLGSPTPLFIGGKSMGGRIATHLAATGLERLQGVVALGYPLHPPGRPEQPRTAHLPLIRVPVLIVQGERDSFGTPEELAPVVETIPGPATLHVVPGGDHSLTVRGRSRDAVYDSVCEVVLAWMQAGRVSGRPGPLGGSPGILDGTRSTSDRSR